MLTQGQRKVLWAAMLHFGGTHFTADQLAYYLTPARCNRPMSESGTRTRIKELVDAGWLRKSVIKKKRYIGQRGSHQSLYALSYRAVEALAEVIPC